MHEIYLQIVSQVRGAWRFRWYALLIAWLVAIVGWLVVYSMPNQYEASAQVYADTDSLLTPLLKGLAIQPNVHTRVRLMAQTLLTRPNLEQVARDTGLDLRASDPKEMDALMQNLGGSIELSGGGRHDLYTISYTDSNPKMAQKVVQSLLNVLMTNTLGTDLQNSTVAQNFLRRQIKDYRSRLNEAERRLADFKKEHIGLIPGQGGRDYFNRLQAGKQQLLDLQDQLKVATAQVGSIQDQIHAMQTGTATASINPRVQAIGQQISEYNDKLNQLLLRYTENYPDVVALKQMIARLNEKREELKKGGGGGGALDPTNPVYQNLQTQLYDAQVKVKSLQTRIGRQQDRLNHLENQADKVTDVEAKLAALTRDYSVTQHQYQDLLGRLDTAQMSQDAAHSGNRLKFRIIDPPVEPLIPVGPPRLLFLSVVLFFSLAAGGAFAVFMHQIRPVFMDRESLKDVIGRPVLGVVSVAWSNAERHLLRAEVMSFGAGLLLLTLAFGGALLFTNQITHAVQGMLPGGWL